MHIISLIYRKYENYFSSKNKTINLSLEGMNFKNVCHNYFITFFNIIYENLHVFIESQIMCNKIPKMF